MLNRHANLVGLRNIRRTASRANAWSRRVHVNNININIDITINVFFKINNNININNKLINNMNTNVINTSLPRRRCSPLCGSPTLLREALVYFDFFLNISAKTLISGNCLIIPAIHISQRIVKFIEIKPLRGGRAEAPCGFGVYRGRESYLLAACNSFREWCPRFVSRVLPKIRSESCTQNSFRELCPTFV